MKRGRSSDMSGAIIPHEVTTMGYGVQQPEPGIDVTSTFRVGEDFMHRSVVYQNAIKTFMQHVFEDWTTLWNNKPSRFFAEPHIRSEVRQFLTRAYEQIKAFGAVSIYVYRDPSRWIQEATEGFVSGDSRAGLTSNQVYSTLPFGVIDSNLGTYQLQLRKRAPVQEVRFEIDPSESIRSSQYCFETLVRDVRLSEHDTRNGRLHSQLWKFIEREEEIERYRIDRSIASFQLARPTIVASARPENPEDPANMDVSRIYQDDALGDVGGHSDQLHRISKKEMLERIGVAHRGIQIHPHALESLSKLPVDMLDAAPTTRVVWVDAEHEANANQRAVFQVDLAELEVALARDICRYIGLPWVFYSGSVGTQSKGDSARTNFTQQHDKIWHEELKAAVQNARETMSEVFAFAYRLAFADFDASLREERDAEIIALEVQAAALSQAPGNGQRLKKAERVERARQLWNTLVELEARSEAAADPVEGARIVFHTSHALELDEIDRLKEYASEGYLDGKGVAWMLNSYLTSRIGELPSEVRPHAPPVEPVKLMQQQMQQAASSAAKPEKKEEKAGKTEKLPKKKKEKEKDNKAPKRKRNSSVAAT